MNASLPRIAIDNEDEDFDRNILAYQTSLRRCVQPDTDSDSESDTESDYGDRRTHPCHQFGIIFLRPFYLPPICDVPRMRQNELLTEKAFQHLFGMTEVDLRDKYKYVGVMTRHNPPPERVSNKGQRTPIYYNWSSNGEPEPNLFNFAAKGYQLPPKAIDNGSDQESGSDSNNSEDDATTLDAKVSRLWRQFLQDLLFKCPNPQSQSESYCKLTREDRTTVDIETYRNRRLSDLFHSCQYKIWTDADFENAFKHLWPRKDHILAGKTQGYKQSRYYLPWKALIATLTAGVVEVIRSDIKKKMKKLYWIPHAAQDKLWPSSAHQSFTRLPPHTSGAAPRILVRSSRPQWEE